MAEGISSFRSTSKVTTFPRFGADSRCEMLLPVSVPHITTQWNSKDSSEQRNPPLEAARLGGWPVLADSYFLRNQPSIVPDVCTLPRIQ
jgi:hypothetical protein